ncbi:MAG: Fpg/Nei family DNA glycosylase [Gemmatimonadetes bacterium]|nr:Fpg/Nei family DNA glycosylase [Gemmatimonadota bacterium]
MPELPEVALYLHALERRIVGQPLERVRLQSPSLLRTYEPPLAAVEGRRVVGLQRMGKRIVWQLEGSLFVVIHLMIAGRFRWKGRGAPVPKKGAHAAFDFPNGTLLLTEAATKKRASLHVLRGNEALAALDRGGLDPLSISLDEFRGALVRENHTLKRALTDPRILSGIGNAHSDEILFRAGLSPVKRTRQLAAAEIERLYQATRSSLDEWIRRLQAEGGEAFPEKVTAFHPTMAVHGKYGQPCPRCGSPVQRIVYAENETNYCARCQTGGKLLRDRALSKLLGEDWPKTIEELEE